MPPRTALPLIGAALAALLALSAACSAESEHTYSARTAFLRFAPTTAAPPLHAALGNPGQWCTLTYTPSHYTAAAPGIAPATYPRTALDAYGPPRSIAGFLIGTPSLPDLDGTHRPRAYDLVCPACLETDYIERALTLDAATPDRAHCPRCRQHYDLTSGIALTTSADGRRSPRLYRYRLAHSPATATLVVQN